MKMSAAWFHKFIAGFLIGLGFILPGVSGGVMAVSFGLYRPMLEAVTGFWGNPQKHLAFLAPLGAGGALGALFGAKGLSFAMARWEAPMLFSFIGLILGGVPALLREADEGGFQRRYLWGLALGVALALPMLLWRGDHRTAMGLTAWQALIAGGIYALGTVVPGLSASFLLIRLGWYREVLSAVGALSLPTVLPLAVGFILAAVVSLRAATRLFERAHGFAYYGVLGFVLVSVGLVYPGFGRGSALWINLLALALGLLGASRISALAGGGAPD